MSETQVLMKFYFFGFFSRYHFLEGTLCLNGRGVGEGSSSLCEGTTWEGIGFDESGWGFKEILGWGATPSCPLPHLGNPN